MQGRITVDTWAAHMHVIHPVSDNADTLMINSRRDMSGKV